MNRKRFVILDRDGTIIVKRDYLADPEHVELLPGAAEGLRRMSAMGLGLAVITNQSGIGRGFFDHARLDQIHERMNALLIAEGITLNGIYACPHHPDANCTCRKPGVALAFRAAADLGFRANECFVIGDNACDIGLGQRLGATTLLVRTGDGAAVEAQNTARPNYCVNDLLDASETIERLLAMQREDRAPRRRIA